MAKKRKAKAVSPTDTPPTLEAVIEATGMVLASSLLSPLEALESEPLKTFNQARKAKSFTSQVEQEPPESFVEKVTTPKSSRRVIEGFINGRLNENTAGIRVNVSHDKQTVAILFDDDKVPSIEEKARLRDNGFRYNEAPSRRQWERIDGDRPAANELDARAIAQSLASARAGAVGR